MEDLSNKKIFITGITGFTGSYLESFYLKKGFKVFGTTYSNNQNSNHFFCDITDKNQIQEVLLKVKPDYVIHTAAISFVAGNNQNKMYDVNVFGTLNLLDALLEAKITPNKIIIASSAAVYGNIGDVLSENMCPKPLNHYGNSKLVMENMVKNYYQKLNILITRPFNYTGYGQANNFLIPKIVKHFKEKAATIELGNINVFREFNDVNYLVDCYNQLLFSDVKSEILNVCSSKTYSIKEILLLMEKISNHNIKVEINPKFVRKNDIKSLRGSTQKLYGIVTDQSSNFSLNDTLRRIYYSG